MGNMADTKVSIERHSEVNSRRTFQSGTETAPDGQIVCGRFDTFKLSATGCRTAEKEIYISPTRLCLALAGGQSAQGVSDGFIIVESNYKVSPQRGEGCMFSSSWQSLTRMWRSCQHAHRY